MYLFKSPISCGVYELGHMGWRSAFGANIEPGRAGRPSDAKAFQTVEEEMDHFLKQYRYHDWPFLMFSDVEGREWVKQFIHFLKENKLGEVMETPALTNPNHQFRAAGIVVYVWMPDWKALANWRKSYKEEKNATDRAPEALADTSDESREEVCDRVSVRGHEEEIFGRPTYTYIAPVGGSRRGRGDVAPHHPQQRLRRGQPRPDGSR